MGKDGRGVAGRAGAEVRSDLRVEIEARSGGGLEIALRSRVEPYFGETIRAQVRDVLGRLGVEHARVEIEDSGALPFVIAARLEAAARRAGVEGGDARPRREVAPPSGSPKDRLRRSRLYLPGVEPKYLPNAGLYRPDGVILDLEDSVHPDEKDTARLLVRNALRAIDFGPAERMVRINQLPLGLADLDAIVPEQPELILVPKVERAEQVREVERRIDELARERPPGRGPWLMPILESALGIENAFEIARGGSRVAALTIGLEDFAADLGVPRTADGGESLWARSRVVVAAKAAGVQAIDSVYGQVDDLEGLRRWGVASRRMGFEGMGCLHPRQIPVIHEAYRPDTEELRRAARIVAAFEEARVRGLAVVSLGSKMIDPPVVRQAARMVERARALGIEIEAGEPDGAAG